MYSNSLIINAKQLWKDIGKKAIFLLVRVEVDLEHFNAFLSPLFLSILMVFLCFIKKDKATYRIFNQSISKSIYIYIYILFQSLLRQWT